MNYTLEIVGHLVGLFHEDRMNILQLSFDEVPTSETLVWVICIVGGTEDIIRVGIIEPWLAS